MRNTFFFTIFFSLFIATPVFAAGGGGGGGGSSVCTTDTWSCSDWPTACGIDGTRHRVCILTTDCPGVETPKPEDVQTCSAPVAPVQILPPVSVPVQITKPKPAETVPAPKSVETPAQPALWKLRCFNKSSLRARIDCRLGLSEEDLTREITTKYLPEECRARGAGAKQKACVELYKKFAPCWQKTGAADRMICARGVIGVAADVRDDVASCKKMSGAAQAACLGALREKVFTYAKFKFYDLSEYAEDYLHDGRVSRGAAVDFVTLMESLKQKFNNTRNLKTKWEIAGQVHAAWSKFLQKVSIQGGGSGDERTMSWPDDQIAESLQQLQDVK